MNAEEQNGHEETTGTRDIGAALARRRREIGLSLRDVENATKIRTRYLEGLEQEDFGALPDQVYVRGFLKTYANFLGLDGEELSREFKERRGPRRERNLSGYEGPTTRVSETEQPLIAPGGLGGAERRRISGATLLTLALAVLILAAVSGGLYLVGSRSAQEPSQEQPAEEDQASGESDNPAENTTPEMVQATVRVVGTSSTGMTVRTDGTVAYDQVAQTGFSQEFEAQDTITVEAANGGAVEIEVDGQEPERLGDPGQPITREFTPEDSGG